MSQEEVVTADAGRLLTRYLNLANGLLFDVLDSFGCVFSLLSCQVLLEIQTRKLFVQFLLRILIFGSFSLSLHNLLDLVEVDRCTIRVTCLSAQCSNLFVSQEQLRSL